MKPGPLACICLLSSRDIQLWGIHCSLASESIYGLIFVVLGFELRALHVLDGCCVIELYSGAAQVICFASFVRQSHDVALVSLC